MRAIWVGISCLVLLKGIETHAQSCVSSPNADSLSGTINSYYPGVGTAAAGATSLSVDTAYVRPVGATPIAAGNILLVIQMQDAAINDTNTGVYGDGVAGDPGWGTSNLNASGRFEYVYVQSTAGRRDLARASHHVVDGRGP